MLCKQSGDAVKLARALVQLLAGDGSRLRVR